MPVSTSKGCDRFINDLNLESDTTHLEQYRLSASGLKHLTGSTLEGFLSSNVDEAGPEVRILIGQGDGFSYTPLPITVSDFQTLCDSWQISSTLLSRCAINGSYDLFEYHLEDQQTSPEPHVSMEPAKRYLNLCFQCEAIGSSVFSIFRYDIATPASVSCFIACRKQEDIAEVIERIQEDFEHLLTSPTSLVALLLEVVKGSMSTEIQGIQHIVNGLEARLEITTSERREWLAVWGHAKIPDKRYKQVNEDIYSLQRDLHQYRYYASILISHGKALLRVVELFNDTFKVPRGFQDVHDLIRRLDIIMYSIDSYERTVLSQAAVLYNLINQRDSRLNFSVAESSRQIAAASRRDSAAMKTISILTLIFLPATFVSAIFSTTIFDFTSTDSDSGSYGKASRAWWVYLLCCLLLTLATVLTWGLWMRWRLKKSAAEDDNEKAELLRE